MAKKDKSISRSLYVERRPHQIGNGLTTILEQDLSTIKTDVFTLGTGQVNVGNFSLIYGKSEVVEAETVKSTGNYIPSNPGTGCRINITVNAQNQNALKTVSIASAGSGYVKDDIFLVPDGMSGSIRIAGVSSSGGVTSVAINTAGYGYTAKNNVDFSDNFWTLQELEFNSEVQSVSKTVSLPANNEWTLKLNKHEIQNFATFGSLSELIRSSFENIVKYFPASMWIVPKRSSDKYDNELSNPFDIDLFVDDTNQVNDPENIRYFQLNFSKYEVVETRSNISKSDCSYGNTKLKTNKLTTCKYEITSVIPTYRYVYIRKKGKFPRVYNINNNGQVIVMTDDILERQPENFNIYKSNTDTRTLPMKDVGDSKFYYNPAYNKPIKMLDYITIQCKASTGSGCSPSTLTLNIDYVYADKEKDYCRLLAILANAGTIRNPQSPSYPSYPDKSYHIKPKEEHVRDFFYNLNDFQSALLTRYTFPQYTSTLRIPSMEEEGMVYKNFTFTWGTPDGYNLDITSVDYQIFIQEMNAVGELCDEVRCDNIYRVLTHDSIKNFDTTHERIEDEAKLESYIFGGTKFSKLLRLYGRQFDEIKKYIDTISLLNNLTYNQQDNYPDALLKTNVEYQGWKSTSIARGKNQTEYTERLFHGNTKEYTLNDTEREFYRRLLINSAHLVHWKGTKHGVEMVMNLFGIPRDNYNMKEYVYVTTGRTWNEGDGCGSTPYFTTNAATQTTTPSGSIKAGLYYYVISKTEGAYITYNGKQVFAGTGFYGQSNNSGQSISTYTSSGAVVVLNEILNLKLMNDKQEMNIKGNIWYGDQNDPEVEKDVIPVNLGLSTVVLSENLISCPLCNGTGKYFGFSTCEFCAGVGEVRDFYAVPGHSHKNPDYYFQQNGGWYQETLSNQIFVNVIEELYDLYWNSKVIEGTVVFVRQDSGKSNYWVLTNIDRILTDDGWYNMSIAQTTVPTSIPTTHKGTVIIDIQAYKAVVDSNEGNNPHAGYGKYDNGMDYIKHISSRTSYISAIDGTTADKTTDDASDGLFKYTIENTDECIKPYPQYKNLINKGFCLTEVCDSRKSWATAGGDTTDVQKYTLINNYTTNLNAYSFRPKTRANNICDKKWVEGNNTRVVVYPSTVKNYQIVNSKRFDFHYNSNDTFDVKEFNEVILPYLEEMVPSTAIFNLKDYL